LRLGWRNASPSATLRHPRRASAPARGRAISSSRSSARSRSGSLCVRTIHLRSMILPDAVRRTTCCGPCTYLVRSTVLPCCGPRFYLLRPTPLHAVYGSSCCYRGSYMRPMLLRAATRLLAAATHSAECDACSYLLRSTVLPAPIHAPTSCDPRSYMRSEVIESFHPRPLAPGSPSAGNKSFGAGARAHKDQGAPAPVRSGASSITKNVLGQR